MNINIDLIESVCKLLWCDESYRSLAQFACSCKDAAACARALSANVPLKEKFRIHVTTIVNKLQCSNPYSSFEILFYVGTKCLVLRKSDMRIHYRDTDLPLSYQAFCKYMDLDTLEFIELHYSLDDYSESYIKKSIIKTMASIRNSFGLKYELLYFHDYTLKKNK